MKKFIIILFSTLLGISNITNAYMMGLKSSDNTILNIKIIENDYKIFLPIVGFIFDPWGKKTTDAISNLSKELGNHRIYHITISPNSYSAKQVAQGVFDTNYKWFFNEVKKQDLKVIFRTMHEMNGGWYPWSADTQSFKDAWIHIWTLSRQAGLDNHNILFDFSLNHWDMPTNGNPSQQAELIECNVLNKAKFGCLTFEDYYPGDKYVDIIGVSFYNWGKGNSDRKWLTPYQILYDKDWNTLSRIKKFNKPIFVDEVGTSAVNYEGTYEYTKTLENFNSNRTDKNYWLTLLKDFLINEPLIYGFVYFNVDYTDKLTNQLIGEADWAVINLKTGKVYEKIFSLYDGSEKNSLDNKILKLFDLRVVKKYDNFIFIKSGLKINLDILTNLLDKKYGFFYKKIEWINKTQKLIENNKSINLKTRLELIELLNKTKELYEKASL